MATSADQMAASLSLNNFAQATELKKRIWFTLAALVVYRFGTYIPIPGINPEILSQVFRQGQTGYIRNYAWVFFVGVVVLVGYFAIF